MCNEEDIQIVAKLVKILSQMTKHKKKEDDIQLVAKLVKILSQMNGTQEERI